MYTYKILMEQHSNTELFKEIIHFMDISFPEWKTNKGLGTTATEFISDCIDFLSQCNLEKRNDQLNIQSLTQIYLSVAEDYERYKMQYQSIFLENTLEKFEVEFEKELEDEYLTDFRYNDLYDTFLNQELEKVIYDFKIQ
ncbi:hypothetical protein IRZ71_15840 [Flavobacterium sp. ANB]|uniref:hypothetical protein n=1 Tax=unclassified Flavobacterium TaxID=196869 RepID=UPI0012B7387B|nr:MULTISPECIES: hypothetical protein [unclassified Flavobacterium]MBF4517837.1 hypothetical protein [Flavobacterium sp. ANB]MTD72093.1 hypothetical protein [Flavobacterium sp. LC2016-13]